ncbi:MAG: 6-phospho-beta-glucosidase [Treponema sp.]|jgi:6-phospho-beta-glucosidase|nr:6-phospho-beta-glucosidase [Treponema sp.]
MKICIIGAGSSYTPELFEKMAEIKERFPVKAVTLMDVNDSRLEAVYSFCNRYVKHLGLEIKVDKTINLDEAVYGADFVNTQIRVGGNLSRIHDERIPLALGFIGQETTGPGGFMKALRTIPAMLKIAESIRKNAPDAWLINYTNPTGIVSQALHDKTSVKCAALCAGGVRTAWNAGAALGVNSKDVQYDIFGLNHLNFSYNIKVRGRPVTDEEFLEIAAHAGGVSPEFAVKLGAIPSGYLQYYYHRKKKTEELSSAPKTRGEQVLELEKEIYSDFRNAAFSDKPPSLRKRGGGGYSTVAMDVMDAIYNNRDTWAVANVPNKGVFRFLPDNAVMETAVMINANGIRPLVSSPPPIAVWGLVSMVKNFEMLTAEAAITGDRDTAILALTHHPLVMDYDAAKDLFTRLLEAHREVLPQFY